MKKRWFVAVIGGCDRIEKADRLAGFANENSLAPGEIVVTEIIGGDVYFMYFAEKDITM